jgi:glutamine amidotransferase
MSAIAVVDYGMGNLHSVRRALEHVAPGRTIAVTQDPAVIREAERVVFPGQGAIGMCRRALERYHLIPELSRAAAEKPFFGMCLGPQFLMDFSEENGGVEGLGVFAGEVVRFPPELSDDGVVLKIPHMGWNRVHQAMDHPLWHGIGQDAWFYFVHSYYLRPSGRESIVGTTEYGFQFAAALARDNVFAVQFHPEKSARDGLRLLRNFIAWHPD